VSTDSRGGLWKDEQDTELHRDSRHGKAQQQPTFLGKTEFLVPWASRIKRLESHLNLFMLLQLVRDGKRETSHIVFE
jgi:hypothetical protein